MCNGFPQTQGEVGGDRQTVEWLDCMGRHVRIPSINKVQQRVHHCCIHVVKEGCNYSYAYSRTKLLYEPHPAMKDYFSKDCIGNGLPFQHACALKLCSCIFLCTLVTPFRSHSMERALPRGTGSTHRGLQKCQNTQPYGTILSFEKWARSEVGILHTKYLLPSTTCRRRRM